jgi:hypothetical protein
VLVRGRPKSGRLPDTYALQGFFTMTRPVAQQAVLILTR